MASKSLVFSGIFISINNNLIAIDSFKEKLTQKTYSKTYQGVYYTFYIDFIEDFLKIYFTHGRPMPLPEAVINTDTLEPEENPRKKNQYEPKPNFALIDFRTGILWLNNTKKKNTLLQFLKEELDEKNIIIKDVFNEAEFIDALKSLDEIKFSAVPDLFSSSSTLTQEMANEIYGYEASVGTFYLKYDNKLVGESLKEKIKTLFVQKNNLRGIMISGRDKKGLGMLFNTNMFSKKIQFNSAVDENEIFNTDVVFSTLITNVKNEDF